MIATLNFELPKQQREYNAAKTALGWQMVMHDLKYRLKKGGNTEYVEYMNELMQQYGVTFDLLNYPQ